MPIPTSIESGKAQVFDQNPYDSPERRVIYGKILQAHEDEVRQRRLELGQLGALKSSSGKLLPIDQVAASKMYGDIENHYVKNRKQNIDPTNPKNIEAYIENERLKTKLHDFINERSQHAVILNKAREITQNDKTGFFDKEESRTNQEAFANNPDRDVYGTDLAIPMVNPLKVLGESVNRTLKGAREEQVFDKAGKPVMVQDPYGGWQKKTQFKVDDIAIRDEARMINDPDNAVGRRHIIHANKEIEKLPEAEKNAIYSTVKESYPDGFNPSKMDETQKRLAAINYWEGLIKNHLPEGVKLTGINQPFVARQSEGDKSPDQLWTKTPVIINPGGGRESFNKKYGQNYTDAQWRGMNDRKEASSYVAVTPVSGKKENVLLDLSGQDFKPEGFKIEDGKILATGALIERIPTGDHNAEGEPIYKEKYIPKEDIVLNPINSAKLASYYHFKDINKFKEWITSTQPKQDPLGIRKPESSKKEVSSTKIASLAKTAGYTDKEYRKLLQDKGVKIVD